MGHKRRDTRADVIAARRDVVAQLRLANHSVRAIADDLAVPKSTIGRDLIAIREEWTKSRLTAVDTQVAEDVERVRVLERAIWRFAVLGDGPSIDRWLRLEERRARLLGLERPKRVALGWERVLQIEAERLAASEGLDVSIVLSELESILERADVDG